MAPDPCQLKTHVVAPDKLFADLKPEPLIAPIILQVPPKPTKKGRYLTLMVAPFKLSNFQPRSSFRRLFQHHSPPIQLSAPRV